MGWEEGSIPLLLMLLAAVTCIAKRYDYFFEWYDRL